MKRTIGNTKIAVSPIGFGTLTLGPFMLNYPISQGGQLIAEAVKRGINLIDTAKAYKTYPYVKDAMKRLSPDDKKSLHIISRSYDFTYHGMKNSFNEALEEMGISNISIFMLHEQESSLTLKGHRDALRFLTDMKKRGRLKALGISTHYVEAVNAACEDPDIDIIFAILNYKGLGIIDGTREDMENVLHKAFKRGKGIFLMKALGGGHFYRNAREALDYVRNLDFIHSVIVGMQDVDEIDYNRSYLSKDIPVNFPPSLHRDKKRSLFIEGWCSGCGSCVKVCPFGALSLKDNKAIVDKDKCMLCSYCVKECKDFCIKVV